MQNAEELISCLKNSAGWWDPTKWEELKVTIQGVGLPHETNEVDWSLVDVRKFALLAFIGISFLDQLEATGEKSVGNDRNLVEEKV